MDNREEMMCRWLGAVCRRRRKEAGLVMSEIAGRLRCDQSVVSKFENGQCYPRALDYTVRVYADSLGIDVIELWQAAIDLWRAEGHEPAPLDHATRVLDVAREAADGARMRAVRSASPTAPRASSARPQGVR